MKAPNSPLTFAEMHNLAFEALVLDGSCSVSFDLDSNGAPVAPQILTVEGWKPLTRTAQEG